MKIKIRVKGGNPTSERSAARLVNRGRARWTGEHSIEIIAEDRKPVENFHARAVVPSLPAVFARIQDATPGMPVLSLIGYNRSSGAYALKRSRKSSL